MAKNSAPLVLLKILLPMRAKIPRQKRHGWVLFPVGLLAFSVGSVSAQTAQTWTAGTGNWTTGSNWTPSGDPNSAVADVYATSGTSVVNLDSSRTAGRVTLGAGDQLNVQNGNTLTLAGNGFSGAGTLVNSGTFRLSGTNSTTAISLGDAANQTITLAGAGAVVFSDSPYNTIQTSRSGITLVNDTNISGAGNLGNGQVLNVINNGSIRATGANDLYLFLNGSGTFTNNGTLRAEAGSRLNFYPVGTFNNAGNTVTADGAGAEVRMSYSSIFNSGTFAGINGGKTILELVSTYNSVSFAGAAEIRNGQYNSIFTGTTTFSGTLAVLGSNVITGFKLGNNSGQTVTLAGPGAIALSDSTNNFILTDYGGITLVNDTNISGAGNLGNGNIQSVINNGSIRATGTNNLNLNLNGSGTFTNNGTLRAEAGSRLNFQNLGTFNNAGNTVTADGAGAELFIGTSSIFNSGTFAGINGGKTILQSASTYQGVSFAGAAEIRNGQSSSTFTGTTRISGTLAVSGSDSTTGFRLGNNSGQTVTLAGPGAIALSDSTNNSIFTAYGGITLVNDTNISGAGNFGNGNIQSVINNGSIRATGTNNLNLNLNGSGTFTNNGTLRAEAGSRLNFQNLGTFHNAGHTVTADGAGAELFIGTSSILNSGTFAGINGGKTILQSASTYQSVSFAGAAEIRNGQYGSDFTGTTTISGTLAVLGSNATTGFQLGNGAGQTVTLAGAGEILLSDSSKNVIYTNYGGITLVNDTNISGAGIFGNGRLESVINNGSIRATGINNLILNISGIFTNNGTLGGQDGRLVVIGNWTIFTNYNDTTKTLTGGTWVATDTGTPGTGEIEFAMTKQVFTNAATISLSGSSAFIRGVSGVTNQNSGTLSISNGHVFTTNTGTMTNTGSLLVTQGAVLNAEYVSTGGSLVMDNGTIDDSAFLSGASTFEGNGTVEGDFTAAGTTNIIPGSGIGTLALQNGSYLQTGGQITLDIARLGGSPTQDAITALNGAVTVSDTTIKLNLLAGSQALQVGDTFVVLEANSSNVGGDLTLTNIHYDVSAGSLSSYTFSTNVNPDSLSFTVLTVPEPSTLVLLGIGLGALALRSRKRASRA